MRQNPRISDLIPFNGDRQIVVEWSNFSNPFCYVMKRLFNRHFPVDDFWLEGISHSMLDNITLDDIEDLNNVGQKRLENTLKEMRQIFATLDEELVDRSISLSISSKPTTYEGFIKEKLEEEFAADPVDSASTVEELRLAILNHFDLYRPIDERARAILIARHFAFGNQEETLEALGSKYGVTRERVRQIASKYEDLVLSSPREHNELLNRILDIANSAESFVEFAVFMTDSGLTEQSDFSIVNAVALCEILQLNDLADLFLSVYEKWEQNYAELDEQTKRVGNYRSKIGLIDLDFMSQDMGLPRDKCKELILRAYPRSIFANKFALARTNKLDTTFENVLQKQLLVSENVECEELVEGIRRHAQHRNAELPGENSEFIGLVEAIAGNPPTLVQLKSNTLENVALSDTDNWLRECFESRAKGILHRSELIQMALDSGRNIATIAVYTLFNPLLRNCGSSVYTLIGNKPNEEDIRLHADIVRKNFPDTKIEYEFIGENIELQVLPNINALGGVIFPPKELAEIVKGISFIPRCDCDAFETRQIIQFSVSNFWMGFTSVFKHAIEVHGWGLEEPAQIQLIFDTKEALLVSKCL